MKHSPPFSGVWPAMITPYDADDRINPAAIRRLIARFIEQGADGVYICGSTGEGPLLRQKEREAIAECVVSEAAGQIPVVVHVGQTAPVVAAELAEHAGRIGADAISSTLPPFYPWSTDQIVDYWKMITRRSNLPFYGYVMHDIGQSEAAVQHWVDAIRQVPTLVGLKFTNESAYQLALMKRCSDGRLNILAGADQAYLSCRVQGSDGAIGSTYNAALPAWLRVEKLYQSGQVEKATQLMMRCAQLVGRFNTGYFLAKLKAVIRRQGIDCGRARCPLQPVTPVSEGEIDDLHRLIEDL
jgi:N-acetylneuraminate lyase